MGAHIITTEPVAGRVRAEFGGEVLADSTSALLLREGSLPPRTYFPPGDVSMDRLTPTDHHTTCPFKGEASYWSFPDGGKAGENVAWGYLEPIDGREDIRGYLSFYDDRVELVRVD
ncbi:MAG: hypothetical protein QOJ69_2167 [Actinomycetota bacterium]|jgi:uncharacterized protein (DUF427 family)|nr:hypothetical protein [Actinomycetota bacterium]